MKRAVKVNEEIMQAMLPSIPQDFEQDMRWMIQRMPEMRKETPVMKRKLSVGLVFALILMLLAVSALAAVILGGKDFVDQVMAPMAKVDIQSDRFTEEEVKFILDEAEKYGIHLPDHVVARLKGHGTWEYKDELMRLFVKTEYGFYPSSWPLEVQHWYEVTMEACGQGDGFIHNLVPGENDLSQEQALQIVSDHIRETYGEEKDINDPDLYLRHMTYTQQIINPYLTTREWYFDYEARDPRDNVYFITLSQDGAVKSTRRVGGIYSPSSEMPGYFISDRFAWAYGDGYGGSVWNTERLQEFQKALQYRVDNEGMDSILPREAHALYQTYLTPDDTMIPEEKAREIALNACEGFEIQPGYEDFILAIAMEGEKGPVWKVTLKLKRGENRMGNAYVELDGRTGEVYVCDTSFQYTYSWREMVTESYWEQHKPEQISSYDPIIPQSTPRPDGLPPVWYSDIAPDWYWEKLDQVGYNGDTAGDLMNQWYNLYGGDKEFWPLEAQCIDYLWHGIYPDEVIALPGLPEEKDINQELAVSISLQAFKEAYRDLIAANGVQMEKVVCGATYWFNQPYDGMNAWEISLFDEKGMPIGDIYVNARTGAVEQLSNNWAGGWLRPNAPTPAPTLPPKADGSPWFWGSDQFAPEYWDRLKAVMDQNGADFSNIEEKFQEWEGQYHQDMQGYDVNMFWPTDIKALYFMYHQFETETDGAEHLILIPEGFPGEEEIRKIALQEASHLCQQEKMHQSWLDSLAVSLSLWDTSWRNEGRPTWTIQFHELGGDFNTRIWVTIDAETGDILHSELDMLGNG